MTKYAILILLTLTACQSFVPRFKFDLHDSPTIPIYNLLYDCTGNEDPRVKLSLGGIKDGELYMGDPEIFKCPKGQKKVFFAFDMEGFSLLYKYINYLGERFNEK